MELVYSPCTENILVTKMRVIGVELFTIHDNGQNKRSYLIENKSITQWENETKLDVVCVREHVPMSKSHKISCEADRIVCDICCQCDTDKPEFKRRKTYERQLVKSNVSPIT